jgi:hypothetical protein
MSARDLGFRLGHGLMIFRSYHLVDALFRRVQKTSPSHHIGFPLRAASGVWSAFWLDSYSLKLQRTAVLVAAKETPKEPSQFEVWVVSGSDSGWHAADMTSDRTTGLQAISYS